MDESKSTRRFRLPDGSRSVQSVWVWRGFFFMSLMAGGVCISFVSTGATFFAAAWGVIAAGWFAISMWLWRKHVRDDNEAWQAARQTGRRAA
jgi:hypothetical protein